jgi:hypothetical protein
VLAQPIQDVEAPAPSETVEVPAAAENAQDGTNAQAEAGPSRSPITRPAATVSSAPIAIGAAMRRTSEAGAKAGAADGDAPAKPRVVFKPSMPTRKVKAE